MPKLLRLNDDANGATNGATNGAFSLPQTGTPLTPKEQPASERDVSTCPMEEPPQLEPAGEWTAESGMGVELSVDQEIDERFLAAPQIGIEFPAFNDGRGLSLAFLLRSRHGYQGDLVATGAVQPDILHYMRRCGFTAAVLPGGDVPDPQTLAPYSDYYQACAIEPEPGRFRIERGPSNIPT